MCLCSLTRLGHTDTFTSTEAEDSTPATAVSDYETAATEGDGLWCPWLQWPVPVIRLPDCTGLTNVW